MAATVARVGHPAKPDTRKEPQSGHRALALAARTKTTSYWAPVARLNVTLLGTPGTNAICALSVKTLFPGTWVLSIFTTSGAGNVHERTPGNRARSTAEPLPVQQTTATTADRKSVV